MFGLSHAVVHCSETTLPENISDGILVDSSRGEEAEELEDESSQSYSVSLGGQKTMFRDNVGYLLRFIFSLLLEP